MSLITMAVLLMAKAPDKAKAVCQRICQMDGAMLAKNIDPTVTQTMVRMTCMEPKPKTWRRMLLSLGKLNSKPMTNIKNTTPNSAKWRMPSEFWASANALGPMTTPTAR